MMSLTTASYRILIAPALQHKLRWKSYASGNQNWMRASVLQSVPGFQTTWVQKMQQEESLLILVKVSQQATYALSFLDTTGWQVLTCGTGDSADSRHGCFDVDSNGVLRVAAGKTLESVNAGLFRGKTLGGLNQEQQMIDKLAGHSPNGHWVRDIMLILSRLQSRHQMSQHL